MPEYCFIQGCPNHSRGKKTLGATTNVTDPKKSRLFYVPKDYILKNIWSKLNDIKKRGRLIFSSYNLFQLICVVEESFLSLAEKNRVFLRDAFESVLVAVAERNLPLIGCISHQKEMMTAAIFQYLILRFRCFSKAKFIEIVEQKKTESHAQMKKKTCQICSALKLFHFYDTIL
jgi:hypothetical protein